MEARAPLARLSTLLLRPALAISTTNSGFPSVSRYSREADSSQARVWLPERQLSRLRRI